MMLFFTGILIGTIVTLVADSFGYATMHKRCCKLIEIHLMHANAQRKDLIELAHLLKSTPPVVKDGSVDFWNHN